MAPADPGPPPRWVGGSSFLVQSAALSRSAASGVGDDAATAAARLGLAERNASGIALLRDAQVEAAVDALRHVAADCEAALGPLDPDTLIAAGNRAVSHAWAGEPSEAVRLIQENLAAREAVFGERHPRTLDARDALGTSLRMAGRAADAASVHALAAGQRARVLGSGHPDTLTSRLGLALDVADAGSLDEAAAELDQLLRADVPLGSRHPVTTAVRIAAADIALALGRADHAMAQLQLALSATEAAYGPAHPASLALRGELAAVAAESYTQPT